MKNYNGSGNPEENSNGKGEANKQSNKFGRRVFDYFHHLNKTWWWQGTWLAVALWFITTALGLFMNGKWIVYGAAASVTILIWMVAVHLAKSLDKKQLSEAVNAPSLQSSEIPAVSTHTDKSVPQTLTDELVIPASENRSQQVFNVTSNNQQGGITAGVVNMGPQPRRLTVDQMLKLRNALVLLPKQSIALEIIGGSTEAEAFGRQVINCFDTRVFTLAAVDRPGMVVPPQRGIIICAPTSEMAQPFVDAFNTAGIEVNQLIGWGTEHPNVVVIVIGLNEPN